MIQKACMENKKAILAIIQDAIADMELKGIHQWDDIYPNEEVINNDLSEGNLYVYIDNEDVKGIIVLDEHQEREYESIFWRYNSGCQLVVHRLCVDPHFQGLGIARQLMAYAEEYGKWSHYGSVRLDSFINNDRACDLYEKLGYVKAGIVSFRKGKFYCFEKRL